MLRCIRGIVTGGIIVGIVAYACGYVHGAIDHINYINEQENEMY